jgi:hypothetical protein
MIIVSAHLAILDASSATYQPRKLSDHYLQPSQPAVWLCNPVRAHKTNTDNVMCAEHMISYSKDDK